MTVPQLPYYLGLLTSQYQTPASPNLRAFLALLLQPFLDVANCAQTVNQAFNINGTPPPVGNQLNYLGELVGASRLLPFTPTGGYSQTLGDADYLTLIQAKIMANQWNGQADSLWFPWQTIFPGSHIYIVDNQNMTCTVTLIGAFTSLQEQMIQNGLIVPQPEAVGYTFVFGTPPFFGFGSTNPTLIKGFATGAWA
jgi:hypothetical protein